MTAPLASDPPVFDLPDRLAAKASAALIDHDVRHFGRIADTLAATIRDLETRLTDTLRADGGEGRDQAALDRDQEVHRLTARLRALRRFGLDLCLGRMVPAGGEAGGADPVYVGRLGLTDAGGERLLIDWRSPAAEPFFGATHASPRGLASRRRYRWSRGRITDYWDEVFVGLDDAADGAEAAALDDQSAFIASLGTGRSARMRDVLGTIQADQDAIIRAGSRGSLVVDGGPGTGKTVVALHRTAYLLYSDPRLARRHGGVLFVGPSAGYLSYVADVLPRLGEDGVQLCTLRDLVPEGRTAGGDAVRPEESPRVASLKSATRMDELVERAVRYHERPPTRALVIETDEGDLRLDPDDWAEAFASAEPGSTHNEARAEVWERLIEILVDQADADEDDDGEGALLRASLESDESLRSAFTRAWPLLDPAGVVRDLWTVPAYLAACAPWLSDDDVKALQWTPAQREAAAWSSADLPLLDAARQRIGDPEATRRARRRSAILARERDGMARVVDDLIASHEMDDGEGLMTMLRGDDVQFSLVDESAAPTADPDALAGPFAHIVVDEAQELTDAEWGMLLRRCPSRSFTIVGDRAQARAGFAESWPQRLARVGLGEHISVASLGINYRTPSEVMVEAEPVIRTALPDANVPTSVRSTGIPVHHGVAAELPGLVAEWLATHDEGVACVIADPPDAAAGALGDPRVRSLTPELAKGLEFDLVVLLDPQRWPPVDRYVAMTRATERLVVLTS